MPLIYVFIFPLVVGLIVTGWQGFKDTPWENFVLSKYIRSYVVAFILSCLAYFFLNIIELNLHLGILFLLILGFERAIGDIYKGFFRKELHPEFKELFKRFHISQLNKWHVRVISGVLCIVAGGLVVGAILYFAYLIVTSLSLSGFYLYALAGLLGGSLSATGGAIKDSQFEGFKPKKFIRSPIVGLMGGLLLGPFENRFYILVLSMVGFERLVVELYKTFITRQVRGIFEDKEVKYTYWMKNRYYFFLQYIMGITFVLYLFLIK